MPWVKRKDSYTGKRHYVETVEREWGESQASWRGGRTTEFFDNITGAVCEWNPVITFGTWKGHTGYGGSLDTGVTSDGKPYSYERGGASVVEQVNIMRNSICTHCRNAIIKRLDPDLQAALKSVTL